MIPVKSFPSVLLLWPYPNVGDSRNCLTSILYIIVVPLTGERETITASLVSGLIERTGPETQEKITPDCYIVIQGLPS